MDRRVIISAALIIVLLAVGVGVMRRLIRTAPTPPTSDLEQPALLVRGLELAPRTVIEPIVGFGTAEADRNAWIAAQVSGEVVEVSPQLRIGASVESGELLLRIDDREYQRQLDRARSLVAAAEAQLARLGVEEDNLARLIEIATTELEISEREYQRVLGLFEAGQAPRRELDVARQGRERGRRTLQVLENSRAVLPQQQAEQRATRDSHQAEIELAKLQIERCRVGAPFAGRVEAVEVELGERVSPGVRLFGLLDPDLIEVPIELPVSLRNRVHAGSACRLKLESNAEVSWSGQVARIAPSAARATRTFSLFVEIDNTQQKQPLMPGLFVRARIEGPVWQDALVIPRGVIQRDHVFVYDDGLARRRAVKIERHLLDQAVVSGLRAGEVVITSNLDALFDGAAVRLQPGGTVATDQVDDATEAPPAGAPTESEAAHGS